MLRCQSGLPFLRVDVAAEVLLWLVSTGHSRLDLVVVLASIEAVETSGHLLFARCYYLLLVSLLLGCGNVSFSKMISVEIGGVAVLGHCLLVLCLHLKFVVG